MRTTSDWLQIEGVWELGQRDQWDWYPIGLTAEEGAAGGSEEILYYLVTIGEEDQARR